MATKTVSVKFRSTKTDGDFADKNGANKNVDGKDVENFSEKPFASGADSSQSGSYFTQRSSLFFW